MRTLIIVLGLCCSLLSYGQEVALERIAGPEVFKLNSIYKTDFGNGKNRLLFPLHIPANTRYCYVTISTESGEESKQLAQGIDLIGQLAGLIPGVGSQGGSTLANVAKQVVSINNGGVIDLYVIPGMGDAYTFLDGKAFVPSYEYTKYNYRGGTLAIDCRYISDQNIYLGLYNGSNINGTWVSIEAVIAKLKPNALTVQAINYTNLGWEAYGNGNIEKCMEYSRKALKYDSTEAVAMLNLALCLLIQNKESEAIPLYINALTVLKQKEPQERQHFLNEALIDIHNARKKYPSMAAAEDIIDLYRSERGK